MRNPKTTLLLFLFEVAAVAACGGSNASDLFERAAGGGGDDGVASGSSSSSHASSVSSVSASSGGASATSSTTTTTSVGGGGATTTSTSSTNVVTSSVATGPGMCSPGVGAACYTGPANTEGVGACQGGMQMCSQSGALVGPCEGETLPAKELCDGVDRDCDGAWKVAVPKDCPTIQAALDAAKLATVPAFVAVAAGTYVENIDFGGAAVSVTGADKATTIIKAKSAGPTVTFAHGEGALAVLAAFTITGGTGFTAAQGRQGGGIYVSLASPTLRNLDVTANTALGTDGYGGGIYLDRTKASLDRIRVYQNQSSYYGGGIATSQDGATLTHIEVDANTAVYGGGIALYFSTDVVKNALFLKNTATYGGGIAVQGMAPLFTNGSLASNSATTGAGLYVTSGGTPSLTNMTFSAGNAQNGGGFAVDMAAVAGFHYSNFFANVATTASGSADPTGSAGNISVAPNFVNVASANPLTWNLHLQAGSGLINAGDPTIQDPDATTSDIGAYGGPGANAW